jgi:two-component system cell cycle sensor histidine kinase/response regulator CckA
VEPVVAECSDEQRTVLVVDDNAAMRRLIAAVLTRHGYRVLAAQDPQEALAVSAAERRIDVLVTDFVLPGMSGVNLALSIGLRHPAARLLYVSGFSARDLSARGVDEGSVPVLQKPFSLDELTRTVRALSG